LCKLQRISGAFLFITVPAYVLFIQLKPSTEIEANFLIRGLQNSFLTVVYIILLLSALFHAGYGLWSLMNDYFFSRNLRMGMALLITCITLFFTWFGLAAVLGIES
jgi:succinate dehydrogenase hydrophobic membrane anchor protein